MNGVDRFRAAVAPLGLHPEIREFDESTHTAAEAAAAIGCPVAAIVKSLVFEAGGAPLLVLVSGPNRVDTAALGARLGVDIGKADAALVKSATGYSIGGVPPLGLSSPLRTVMDADLLELDVVWAAAGSATSVFPIGPADLARLTRAEVVPVDA
ncbi:YbaK/EbsC family protein [Pseudolysinimonas kribbensis]|uniref:Aminoacyl-tRNA deacylase n=1 Tax=Pseudolysinimonas kribbensis TaxID=433641 RepID=A0ABQ6JZW6_9MICO|nr:YbaK/EbsC family protein [Pseudolysinimonas kribbensis]GMA93217.1 aminoacyl-tRNA deacylase [Pseudolysinimonas kribbensis]GMA97125.1 aminoacyl-tRNA deacylase [Pseudolysinimonas kribbensis]